MADWEKRLREKYEQNLDPHEFQSFKLQGFKIQKNENNYDFWFSCLNKAFTSGRFTGHKLLELGSGPTVHNVATASTYFNHIVLSDLVEANRIQLQKWIRAESDCMDWSPFLKRVAKAEGHSDPDGTCKEIESRIRAAVKDVVHCDVLEESVFPPEVNFDLFDVILTSLTFETAALDWMAYLSILKRANRLLRLGGALMMIGATECSYWEVGDKTFHCLSLKEGEIERALTLAGFGDVQWTLRHKPDDELKFDCNKLYFITCVKL